VGDRTCQLSLPPDVPAKLFWSVTAYDATTAAGRANDVQMNEDGSVTLYFGPQPLDHRARGRVRGVTARHSSRKRNERWRQLM
jgi:hypothetical protein